jgi:hypothetical protein
MILATHGILASSGGIDAQAQAHYNRVIADGGVVPAGLSGVNGFFTAVKTIYGTSDITTAVSVGLDAQYLGYKLGAGAGTTAGQAVQKLYSCAGSSGDVVQTTAASQPLLLAHNGASSGNYWFNAGVIGNYLTTPNASANQITGDIEIIAKIEGKPSSGESPIVSKYRSSNLQFTLTKTSAGEFILYLSSNGSTNTSYTSDNYSYSNGTIFYLKVTRVASSGIIKFFTSTDGTTYTQLGTNISGFTGSLFNGNAPIEVGGYFAGTISPYFGSVYRATIANSIGGTPVVDFNPATYNASTSQTQWTSTTGEVWTINTGTAATGYKGVLVDRTEVQGDGIDDKLNSGVLSSVSTFTRYVSLNPFQRTGFGGLVSGGNLLNTALYKDSSAIRIYNGGPGVGAISFTSPQNHLLALFTADYNTSNSKAAINNGTDATGTIGNNASTAINVFSDNTSAGNGMISTIISCRTVNNSSQKTAMYNYIRSINNNAF